MLLLLFAIAVTIASTNTYTNANTNTMTLTITTTMTMSMAMTITSTFPPSFSVLILTVIMTMIMILIVRMLFFYWSSKISVASFSHYFMLKLHTSSCHLGIRPPVHPGFVVAAVHSPWRHLGSGVYQWGEEYWAGFRV